jgi:hypothetical protein
VLGIHCLTHVLLMHFSCILSRYLIIHYGGEFYFSLNCSILNIMSSTVHGFAFHSCYSLFIIFLNLTLKIYFKGFS